MGKTNLAFFHNSDYRWDKLPALFKPRLREENKLDYVHPTFYWFSDSWHSYIPTYRQKYFYLFVKNPKDDNIKFRARHEGCDFNALYTHYNGYLKSRGSIDLAKLYSSKDRNEYCEPSILMSFDEIEPDLVLYIEKSEDKYGTVIKPESHKGKMISLFDEKFWPIRFIDNPDIVEILPQIKNSYPFIYPKMIDGKYTDEYWGQMISESWEK